MHLSFKATSGFARRALFYVPSAELRSRQSSVLARPSLLDDLDVARALWRGHDIMPIRGIPSRAMVLGVMVVKV